jgi:hypothetical protein
MYALSAPTIIVNGDKYKIIPNSLKYQGGEGEINVRAASGGGQDVESVHTVNVEDKISMVSFDMFVTTDTDKNIAEWKNNVGANVIEFVQVLPNRNSIERAFPSMSLTNHPEREASADGAVTVEFKGDPMLAQ